MTTAAACDFDQLDARVHSTLTWLSRAAAVLGGAHLHVALVFYEAQAVHRLRRMMRSLDPEIFSFLTPEQLRHSADQWTELDFRLSAVLRCARAKGLSRMPVHGQLLSRLAGFHTEVVRVAQDIRRRVATLEDRFGHLDLAGYREEMTPADYRFFTTFVGADAGGFTPEDRDPFCKDS